jgi:hypothetical protein
MVGICFKVYYSASVALFCLSTYGTYLILGRLNGDTRVHKFPRLEAPDDTFPGKTESSFTNKPLPMSIFIILFTSDHYQNYNT